MEIIDFDCICRICWTSNSLQTMFNDEIPSLCEMLMACVPIVVCEENGLPTKLCLKCSKDVEKMFAFRAKCIDTDSKMKKYLVDHGVQTTVHYTHNPETCETIGTINTTFLLDTGKDHEITEETDYIINNEFETEECLVTEDIENENDEETTILITNEYESEKDQSMDSEFDKTLDNTTLLVSEELYQKAATYNYISDKQYVFMKNSKHHEKKFQNENYEKSFYSLEETDRIFKCSVCQHIFSRKNALIRHLRVIHREITYKHFTVKNGKVRCLKSINYFIENVKQPTTEIKGIFSDLENSKFESNDTEVSENEVEYIEEHLQTEKEINTEPEISENKESDSKICDNLKAKEEETLESYFVINGNGQSMESDDSNTIFVDGTNGDDLSQVDSIEKNETPTEATNKITIFQCDYCLNEFTRRIDLKVHLKKSHQIKKTIDENPDLEFSDTITGELIKEIKFEYETLKATKPSIDSSDGINRLKYPCKFCDRSYFARNNLQRHIKMKHLGVTEEPERNFICEICSKGFVKKGLLERHKEFHFQRIAYQCDQCGDVFEKKIKLRFHMMKHQGKKQYQCDECLKWFLRNSTLKVHKRVHAEVLPFPCTKCDRSFTLKPGLEAHLRTHSSERPYVCSICKRTFRHPGHLDTHMKLHTGERPFSCTICSKGFTTSTHYKYHMKVHLGQKDYKCKLCGNAFINKSELKYHLLKHTKVKEHPCPSCGKMFARTYQVTKHLKQVHKIKRT